MSQSQAVGASTYVPGIVHDCMLALQRRGRPRAGEGQQRSGVGAEQVRQVCGSDAASDSGQSGHAGDESGHEAGQERVEEERQRNLMQVLVWDPVALHELKGLPRVYPRQPLLWIPRALRDRVCVILCGLLRDAVQSREPEYANVLLFHSAQLLLRLPPQIDASAGPPDAGEATGAGGESSAQAENAESGNGQLQGVVSQVREGVVLAEKGACGQLVHALYLETIGAAQVGKARGRDATPSQGRGIVANPAGTPAPWNAPPIKGRIGSPKAAANIRCGQFPVAPGPETIAQLEALVAGPLS